MTRPLLKKTDEPFVMAVGTGFTLRKYTSYIVLQFVEVYLSTQWKQTDQQPDIFHGA